MAFNRNDFNPGSRGGKAPNIAAYETGDDFATVEGGGYFDEISTEVEVGDMLYVHSTNANATGSGSGAASKLYFIKTISNGAVTLSTGTEIS